MTVIHSELAARLETAASADKREAARPDAWRLAFERAGDDFGGWFPALPPQSQPAFAPPGGAGGMTGQDSGIVCAGAARSRPAASLFASATPAPGTAAAPAGLPSELTMPRVAVGGAAEGAAATDPSNIFAGLLSLALGRAVDAVSLPMRAIEGAAPPGSLVGAAALERRARASGGDTEAPDEDAAPARPGQAPIAAEDQEPVRTHVEEVDGGVRIWLGADAQALAAVAPMVGQLQQWFAGQGMRLLSLVCNGRAVWTAPQREPSAVLLPQDPAEPTEPAGSAGAVSPQPNAHP